MRKNFNKKTIMRPEETELQRIIAELSEMREKRERELQELDRIAKMLVRRDLQLSEMRERREKELLELDRIAKMLVRRDFELAEIGEKRERELQELKRITEERMVLLIRERALARDVERKVEELEKTRIALMNILEDVEEARKKAEEEKNKTFNIIQNFADGLLVFDRENKLSLVNPQAEKFFNLKAKDLIGKSISELATFLTLQPLTNLLGPEIKNLFRRELAIREDLILEVTTTPMTSGEEKVGTLVILHDVTREKIVERMKTEFVSISAHQLRTPLSAIKWSLKMLLDGDVGEITEEQKSFIKKTYEANEKMIELINDLLDVTRIEEGRYLYKLELTEIEKIVENVLAAVKQIAEDKKISLTFKRPKEKLPKIRVDKEKISLAIQNLIENALYYTLPGGKVTVFLKYAKNKVELSVSDTGIGIPKDQQKRVFSKFFRGANAIRMETRGSGLGLYITKNIIEAHGGKIWFESEEGKGTTFYFNLPF